MQLLWPEILDSEKEEKLEGRSFDVPSSVLPRLWALGGKQREGEDGTKRSSPHWGLPMCRAHGRHRASPVRRVSPEVAFQSEHRHPHFTDEQPALSSLAPSGRRPRSPQAARSRFPPSPA